MAVLNTFLNHQPRVYPKSFPEGATAILLRFASRSLALSSFRATLSAFSSGDLGALGLAGAGTSFWTQVPQVTASTSASTLTSLPQFSLQGRIFEPTLRMTC